MLGWEPVRGVLKVEDSDIEATKHEATKLPQKLYSTAQLNEIQNKGI